MGGFCAGEMPIFGLGQASGDPPMLCAGTVKSAQIYRLPETDRSFPPSAELSRQGCRCSVRIEIAVAALAEESAGDSLAISTSAPKSGAKGEKSERYTAAARRENHRRATDILPRGRISIFAWYLVGLTIVAGLLVGYANLGNETIAGLGLAPLLDASQGGSLASWFSSLAFGLAAVASVLIYSVRRYKTDDYRGSYRLWLWCAIAFIAMSIDATANLHAPFSRAMARVSGWSMLPDGSIWWITVWGAVMSILALRLLMEVRECRTAFVGFVSVIGLWTAALAIECGWLPIHDNAELIAAGCRLVGQLSLLSAIGVYGRHVLLDAEGLLKVRDARPKREKVKKSRDTSTGADSSRTTRNDLSHKPAGGLQSYVQAAVSRNSGGASSSSSANTRDVEDEERYSGYDEEDDDDAGGYGNRKLVEGGAEADAEADAAAAR